MNPFYPVYRPAASSRRDSTALAQDENSGRRE